MSKPKTTAAVRKAIHKIPQEMLCDLSHRQSTASKPAERIELGADFVDYMREVFAVEIEEETARHILQAIALVIPPVQVDW